MVSSGVVYVLGSLRNNTYYIGSTSNLERRIDENLHGKSPYTSHILPVELVFSQSYKSIHEARKVEAWLKKLRNKTIIKQIVNDGIITKQVAG